MSKSIIIDDQKTKTRRIKDKKYSIFNIVRPKRVVVINETIPFRVRFTNIGIESYNSNNVPGIGIQVIGFSNYIL